jgi:hypothetical protein
MAGETLFYRENRIQESGVRIQEKSGSCLFSWTGVVPLAMAIYRENVDSRQWAVGSFFGPFSCTGVAPLPA